MLWEKLGRIFQVDNNADWMCTHAALPVAHHLHDDVFRIFFSTRDKNNRSHGAYVDIDLFKPGVPLDLSSLPLVSPGAPGLFDDCGVSLSCYVAQNEFFYYLGWSVPVTVPFSNFIGAFRMGKGGLTRISPVPIMDRCDREPLGCGYPWVMVVGGIYRMWYDTNLRWEGNTVADYRFTLRYAESRDGVTWSRSFRDCLKMAPDERSLSRPVVLFEDSIYKMWYSVNTAGRYRIGYAESVDGLEWHRKDHEAGITVSESGWDSEEIEYPFIFDHGGERYMLYNGNGYGKTGFGLAKLKQKDL